MTYKIDFIFTDGVKRGVPTWHEIRSTIITHFGGERNAYVAFLAYCRDREGWDLSPYDRLMAFQWRYVLEDTFSRYSRPPCLAVIVRRETDTEETLRAQMAMKGNTL